MCVSPTSFAKMNIISQGCDVNKNLNVLFRVNIGKKQWWSESGEREGSERTECVKQNGWEN